jgi:uncharacterized phage protein (TIGR01671 family)
MRKIKFRAWDKEAKQMLSVRDIDFCGEEISTYGTQGDWIGFDYVELMQFTGMLDKNKKEIYEGDIVIVHDDNDLTGAIIWDKDELEYQIQVENVCTKMGCYYSRELEIIGNIYESEEIV